MCGFAGAISLDAIGLEDANSIGRIMGAAIQHRGPDDGGVWVDVTSGVFLSHRRLSILDLTEAGHQPMHSFSGRYVIAFNGEIYNHLELRQVLDVKHNVGSDFKWRGQSDTETLLRAIEIYGVDGALQKIVGMFAFAIWDKELCQLILARDRLGEKPVYYGWQGSNFIFGSELKALKAHPSFGGALDRSSLCLYLRHGYIPAPYSIYKDVCKLLPGTYLQLSLKNKGSENYRPQLTINSYWNLVDIAKKKSAEYGEGEKRAVDDLEDLLNKAVRQQMLADVPLGAFLSGGVDSSTVVALMQSQSTKPIQTFTIGFHEASYDEASQARTISGHLGTEHTELYVSPEQTIEIIPQLPILYDEPFADSSQIPTFLIAKLAKEKVSVALSGDGGDELFFGYSRYQIALNISKISLSMPKIVRLITCFGIEAMPVNLLNGVGAFLPSGSDRLGDKLYRLSGLLRRDSFEALYLELISQWNDPAALVIGAGIVESPTFLKGNTPNMEVLTNAQKMMVFDLLSYLPDDILTKVDRAAMGVSLETRVPFLDHRVVEFSLKLPQSYKVNEGENKWILKEVLKRYIPPQFFDRPKMGFGVPIDDWLRGPLRKWAESLLDEDRLAREGIFHPALIRKRWLEHLSGRRNWHHSLWSVLMFQAWHEVNQ